MGYGMSKTSDLLQKRRGPTVGRAEALFCRCLYIYFSIVKVLFLDP